MNTYIPVASLSIIDAPNEFILLSVTIVNGSRYSNGK